MRHRRNTTKLKRTAAHRRSLLANLACSLIEHGSIRTTLAKAKALRPVAEKMIGLGKRGDLHARRQAVAFLRQKDIAKKLFEEVAPLSKDRQGGYCRITKLGARMTDSAPMAVIEWVDQPAVEETAVAAPAAEEPAAVAAPAAAEEAAEAKPAKKKAAKKAKAADEAAE
ncbi:50S ribosomal protein L17 [Luteolibacter rhizosphaerae]|uniref:50S ribosomal protein L17 n=1 Tax=Luteolibacter rhizosphaerae TaxID=2989719 RepID=UPI0029CAB282|nr:50S ribosomal protein L17 [Luteolibacter rhizosphaerae]